MSDIDRLFEAAFDGNELDAQSLRAKLSGRDAEEFDALLTLKSDLRALKDVPECQLTTDHLRRAILNQPAPMPRTWPRFLTYASLAAAAGLVVLSVAKFGPSGTVGTTAPTVAVNTPGTTLHGDEATKSVPPIVQELGPDASDATSNEVGSAKSPTIRDETPKRRSSRRASSSSALRAPSSDKTAPDASGPVAVADSGAGPMGAGVGGSGVESAPSFDAAVDRRVDTVVVVSDHSNPMTGAADAQEVSRPSDVLFGG